MRPRKLTMQGFGPYAEAVTVDFDRLNAERLFLICGDTGAGKTTIFDAVSFALYGEASGGTGRRSARSFRSDYVGADTETYVELVFSHRGETYTVRRNPEYQRAKKRGTGLVTQPSGVAVTRHSDGLILNTREQAEPFLRALIGLDRDQFSQTVMIAQGDFLKILNATSAERRSLFQKLFETSRIARFQELLRQEHSLCAKTRTEIDLHIRQAAGSLLIEEDTPHAGLLRSLSDAPEQIGKAIKPLQALCDRLKTSCEAKSALCEKTEQAYQLRQKERVEAAHQNELLRNLHTYEAKLTELEKQADAVAANRKELDAARQAETIRQAFDRMQLTSQQKQAAANTAQDDAALLPLLQKQHENAAEKIKEAEQNKALLPTYEAQIRTAEKALELLTQSKKQRDLCRQAADRCKALAEAQRHAEEDHKALQAAFQAGLAQRLAAALRDGEPCPVCGAKEHPAKAKQTAAHITDAMMDAAEKQLADARAEYERQKQISADRNRTMQEMLDALSELLQTDTPDETALHTMRTEAQQQIRKLTENLQTADAAARKAELKLVQQQSKYEASKRAAAEAAQAADTAQKAYTETLSASVFPDETSFLNAVRTQSVTLRLTEQIQAFDTQSRVLHEQIAAAKAQCRITKEIPLAELDAQIAQLAEQLKIQRAEKEQLLLQLDRNAYALEQLLPLEQARSDAETRYAAVRDLYQTVGGQQAGQVKLSFEAYVQQFYFKRVVEAANRRLERLTDGMFLLRCRSEADSLRGQAGLDLEVYDCNTGLWRSVSTLSGGESFQASLALALGLSDVVQAQSGGIELDAMFIDEGFGSLDDQTLWQAMRMLAQLADGTRLIGVISHISRLKAEIPAQIRVTKTTGGSKLTVCV